MCPLRSVITSAVEPPVIEATADTPIVTPDVIVLEMTIESLPRPAAPKKVLLTTLFVPPIVMVLAPVVPASLIAETLIAVTLAFRAVAAKANVDTVAVPPLNVRPFVGAFRMLTVSAPVPPVIEVIPAANAVVLKDTESEPPAKVIVLTPETFVNIASVAVTVVPVKAMISLPVPVRVSPAKIAWPAIL